MPSLIVMAMIASNKILSTSLFVRLSFILLLNSVYTSADFPCISRRYAEESIVCVCNSTYCDTLERIQPQCNTYNMYTSSEAGSRFLKSEGFIENYVTADYEEFDRILELVPNKHFQTILGFGAACTDAAGLNWLALSEKAREKFINTYFSSEGNEYSMIRVTIAGSDFSPSPYYYNEYPENDKDLTNFTLNCPDVSYKIPMIRAAMAAATDEVLVFGSVWSPPQWMKWMNNDYAISRLKSEYFQTYADYYCKFAQLYEKQGVPIWGVTTTNEPLDGAVIKIPFQTLGWSVQKMGQFIKENLGPTMKTCVDKPIKVLAADDQRLTIPLWFTGFGDIDPELMNYIDGVGMHGYLDSYVPGDIIAANLKNYPDKFVLSTEFSDTSESGINLGSWRKGETYIVTILDNLVNHYVAWVDWNMAVDLQGGPNWAQNFGDSEIVVNSTSDEFYKQPMYYVLGHFSKFIPRGSKRIDVIRRTAVKVDVDENNIYSSYPDRKDVYDHVAFLTPRETVVVVLANYEEDPQQTALIIGSRQITVDLEAKSIVTVEFPYYC
ncbi:lysosomal acid glucosylceramidase-like [Leptidea sinapis]|uniref:lysosomal acid glucosylceramidase-like n=1 Tax=Leptidea sinapis TaxID=189913 RepID=UPI0021288367|nr:lysosomal acid glucosylceramidase-like [Leptidea sinapis]